MINFDQFFIIFERLQIITTDFDFEFIVAVIEIGLIILAKGAAFMHLQQKVGATMMINFVDKTMKS